MTVEQYLRKQCMQRTDALKRHMEGLIENFEGEAKKARVVLRDVATNAECSSSRADDAEAADTSTENESSGSNAPLAEAFALVCVKGCFAGRVYRFQPSNSQKKWTIGRVEENDVCLAGDDEVSSKHAEITFTPKDKQFKLKDKGSTNGTFVSNGTRRACFVPHALDLHVAALDPCAPAPSRAKPSSSRRLRTPSCEIALTS